MVSSVRITKAEGVLAGAKVTGEPEEFASHAIQRAASSASTVRHEEGFDVTAEALASGDRGVSLEDVESKLARES